MNAVRVLFSATAMLVLATPVFAYDPGTAGPLNLDRGSLGKSYLHCSAGERRSQHPTCRLPDVPMSLTARARAQVHMERAVEAFRLRYFEDTELEITAAIDADPGFWEPHLLAARYTLAQTLVNASGQAGLEVADRHLRAAETLARDNADVAATRAYVLWMQSRWLDAVELYSGILADRPDHLFSREQRAAIFTGQRRPDLALADYDALLDLKPRHLRWRQLRSRLHIASGNYAAAAADLDVYVAGNPYDREAYLLRSHARVMTGETEGALDDLNLLIDGGDNGVTFVLADDDRAALMLQRAVLLFRMDRPDRAIADALGATSLGGRPQILRLQITLRKFGLDVDLDGEVSDGLRQAIRDCFSQDACAAGIFHRV